MATGGTLLSSSSAFDLFAMRLTPGILHRGTEREAGAVPSREVGRGQKRRISNVPARVLLGEVEIAMLNDNLIKFN